MRSDLSGGDVVGAENVLVGPHERSFAVAAVSVVDDEDVVAERIARDCVTGEALHVSADFLVGEPLRECLLPAWGLGVRVVGDGGLHGHELVRVRGVECAVSEVDVAVGDTEEPWVGVEVIG